VARGLDPPEARRRARLALGGPEHVKEECRDVRGTRWLEDLLQEIRYALRTLRQRPGFLTVALLTLALGSGATTVMFTVINGVLLRSLPFPNPDRLVAGDDQAQVREPFFSSRPPRSHSSGSYYSSCSFRRSGAVAACTGIYGALAYLTGWRVPEIGIRMALGVGAGDVLRMVLRQSLRMICPGIALGAGAAIAAGRVLVRLVPRGHVA
jgi:hypothetical protein